jgi:hypothetical protein
MKTNPRLWALALAATACLLAVPNLQADNYIIPIWAESLPGADGTWWGQVIATNPNAFPVSLTVRAVYPLMTEPCVECSGAAAAITIPALSSLPIRPPSGLPGRRLTAGAFEVETSAAVHLHVVAYRAGATSIRQRLDVARRWLTPGRHAIHSVERSEGEWRINLFITNPADIPISVSAWVGDRAENEIQATVAPRSTGVVAVPRPLCGGVPCTYPADFPPSPIRIEVESNGPFLASVSSVAPTWAVFSIAEETLH